MEGWDLNLEWGQPEPAKPTRTKKEEKRRQTERAVATSLTPKYLYRRAFSEIQLRDALQDIEIKPGICINILTGGNIDQMSYLSYFVREQRHIDELYITTWCMSAEDATQLINWIEYQKIDKCNIFVGEIFKSSYSLIFNQLKDYFDTNPERGSIKIFKCHAKIIAGTTKNFNFSVQTSANMDTNPRTEQACIQIGNETFQFYKEYLDGINSFE